MEVEHVFSEVLGDFVGRSRLVVGDPIEHFVQGLLTAETHENLNFGQIYTHPPSKKMGKRLKKAKFINNPSTKRGCSPKKRFFTRSPPSF
jgi:hypothetical protein